MGLEQTCSRKDQIVNILDFTGPEALCSNYSVAIAQKAVIDNTKQIMWLCFNKTFKIGSGLDLARGP